MFRTSTSVSQPLKLRPLYFDLVWLPDLYIFNAISDSPVSQNVDMRFLKVRGIKGTRKCGLEYAVKSFAVVDCSMEFSNYPVDIQHCPIKIRSCKYVLFLQSNPFESNPFESNPFKSNPFESNPFESNPFESNPFESNPFPFQFVTLHPTSD